jgi:hypothetical protein
MIFVQNAPINAIIAYSSFVEVEFIKTVKNVRKVCKNDKTSQKLIKCSNMKSQKILEEGGPVSNDWFFRRQNQSGTNVMRQFHQHLTMHFLYENLSKAIL